MATSDEITERLRRVMAVSPPGGLTYKDPFAQARLADEAIGTAALTPTPVSAPTRPPRPIRGMEKLGALPTPPPPPLPGALGPAQISDYDRRMAAISGVPTDEASLQRSAEMMRSVESLYPTAIPQIAAGLSDLPTRPLHGSGEVARGLMKAGAPVAVGTAMATPLPALIGLGTGMAAGTVANRTATAFGARPETAQDVGDVIGLLSGVLSGVYAGGKGLLQARSAAEFNRLAEVAMSKIPEATAEQAAQLRAQAAALTHAAQQADPSPLFRGAAIPTTARPPRALSPEAGVLVVPNPRESWRNFEEKWVDAGMPIRHMEERGNVPIGDTSAYMAYRNFAGNPGRLQLRLKERDAILGPVDKLGLRQDVNRYLELQRHEENFLNPDKALNYETPGNMTLQQVQSELLDMQNRLGPDRMAVVGQAAQGLRGWNDKALREYYESGMLEPDQFDAMTQPGHKYAPLQRTDFVPEDTEHVPLGGRSFNTRNQPVVKELKGSAREIVPPIEGFTRNVLNMTRIADRNRVTALMGDMAEQPEFQGIIRPLKDGETPGKGEGPISTFRNGVKEAYAVPEPVAKAVAGMNLSDADLMMRWAKKTHALNRVMIEGSTTFNPAFQIGNVIRDYKTATLKAADAGYLFTPRDWLKGFWSAVKEDQFFDRYLDSGGAMSGFFERMRGNPSTSGKVWDAIHWPSTKIEQAPRVAFFRKMDEANLRGEANRSLRQMGFLSRNATTDFARSGSDMRQLNLWIPMLNARKEGLVNSLAAFKSSPVKSLLVLNAFAVPTVLSYFHNVTQYPEVWKDISQQYKNNYDFLITGPDKDEQNNYPKVWGLKKDDIWAAYSNLLVDSLERFRGQEPQAWSRMATQMLSDTLPFRFAEHGNLSGYQFLGSVLPAPAKALIIEPAANRNLSTGAPIETAEMQKDNPPPWSRYTNDTPQWLVGASKLIPAPLRLSPRRLQNMVTTQFGAAGRMVAGDVRQGRDPLMERTGLGPVTRMFTGAPGGNLEQKDFERAQPVASDAAAARLERGREIDRLWRETKDLPPKQRIGVLSESYRKGKMDLPTFEKYMGTAKDGVEKISNFERWLRAEPLEARAPIIVQKLDLAPDLTAAREIFQRYNTIGVLTDDAFDAIGKIYAQRGHGPSSSAQGKGQSQDQTIKEALKRVMRGGR